MVSSTGKGLEPSYVEYCHIVLFLFLADSELYPLAPMEFTKRAKLSVLCDSLL